MASSMAACSTVPVSAAFRASMQHGLLHRARLPTQINAANSYLASATPLAARSFFSRGVSITGAGGRSGNRAAETGSTFPWKGLAAVLLLGLPASKIALDVLPLHDVKTRDYIPQWAAQQLDESLGNTAAERRVTSAEVASEGTGRLVRDVATALAIIKDYKEADPSANADWSEVHQRAADRLLKLCQVNKGIYIKLGQHVAQLEYLLPKQYVRTMEATLTQAPQDDFHQVKRVVEQDLGCSLDDMFLQFDEQPIASASLAQVHLATLRSTGERVAVKVQHEGLRELSQVDITTIAFLVDTVKRIFPKFEYTWLVDEIKQNLPRELDFRLEGKNCEEAGRNFADDDRVAVPTIHWEHSSARVLTMSFETGCYITNVPGIVAQGLRPADVAAVYSDLFSKQVFKHGFVHADPHAGNVLVRQHPQRPGQPQIVLLDHGLYRPLDDAFRVTYARLWRALIFGDEEGIRRESEAMGAGDMYRLFAAILTTRSWDEVSKSSLDSLRVDGSEAGRATTSAHAKQYQDEIQEILCRLPREMLLLLKTNDCMRAVDAALGTPVNTFVTMAVDCVDAIAEEELKADPSWGTWAACQMQRWRVWGTVTAYKLAVAAGAAAPPPSLAERDASAGPQMLRDPSDSGHATLPAPAHEAQRVA